MTGSIAIFTYPSITGLVRNAMQLRRADQLILYRHGDQRHPERMNKIFGALARLIANKSVEVRTLTQFNQPPYSIDVLSALDRFDFENDSFVAWIQSSLGLSRDSAIRYARRVSLERGFLEIAAKSATESEFFSRKVLLSRPTRFADFRDVSNVTEINGMPIISGLVNSLCTPFILYVRLLREILSRSWTIATPEPAMCDLLVYEIGYRHESMPTDENIGATKSRHRKNNSTLVYVHDKDTSFQFISDIWRPDDSLISDYKSALGAHGYRYVDWAKFKIGVQRIVQLHALWGRAAFSAICKLTPAFAAFDAARAVGLYARESIIADNVDARGTLGFDDYSERTIIRHQVAGERGRKTLCVQHSANDGVRSESEITTVVADHYLTMSEFTRSAFKDYWPSESLVPFGYARLDDVLPEIMSRSRSESPFAERKNAGCPVVVIALPNIRSLAHFREILPGADEFLTFLEMASNRYKDSLNIYLRPKQLIGWEETIDMIGFGRENILLDRDMLTAEYMFFADLVICNVGSGVMSECALLKTTVAMFDFFKAPTDIYSDFGEGFFNATANDMIRQLDLLAEGKPLEIEYEKQQRLFSDPYNPDRPRMIHDLVVDRKIPSSNTTHSLSETLEQAI